MVKRKKTNSDWTKTWPTKPGHYWFHGWLHVLDRDGLEGRHKKEAKTYLIEGKMFDKFRLFTPGYALDKKTTIGLWKSATASLPEPPELAEVER